MRKKVILIAGLAVVLALAGIAGFWILQPQVDSNIRRYDYKENADGTLTLTSYRGFDTVRLRIPDQLGGKAIVGLDQYCFLDADKLIRVDIPAGITTFSGNPFAAIPLRTIRVDSGNPALRTVNGMLYSVADGRLLTYPAGIAATSCVLPAEISIIGGSAFSGSKNLTAVALHDGITAIETIAFADCDSLTAIAIPASVASVGINPFVQCTALQEIAVSLENAALAVEEGMLYSRADMRLIAYAAGSPQETLAVPQGIQTVGIYAFASCGNLTAVTLPST